MGIFQGLKSSNNSNKELDLFWFHIMLLSYLAFPFESHANESRWSILVWYHVPSMEFSSVISRMHFTVPREDKMLLMKRYFISFIKAATCHRCLLLSDALCCCNARLFFFSTTTNIFIDWFIYYLSFSLLLQVSVFNQVILRSMC